MTDYISREALFKTVEDYASTHPVMRGNELFALFCSIPASDVRPVVKARWGEYEDELFGETIKAYCCSNCHHLISRPTIVRNYCPRCGAKMEES